MPTLQDTTQEKKVQELLRSRVKVENKWPGCQFEVDDILIKDGDYYWVVGDIYWHGKIPKSEVEPFPYLMRPIPWWEDRAADEMPEYLQDAKGAILKGVWEKSTYKSDTLQFRTDDAVWQCIDMVMCFFEPSTESDYLNYINNTRPQGTKENV